jgi:hypothetical protein
MGLARLRGFSPSRAPAQSRPAAWPAAEVLAGDAPVDWSLSSPPPLRQDIEGRDNFARSAIEREVLDKGRRALVLFGAAHLYRNRPGTIVDLLRDDPRARWFVIVPIGGPGLPGPIAAQQASAPSPAFIALAGRFGGLAANGLFERGTQRVKLADGKPVLIDGRPVFEPAQVFEPVVTAREVADACLYFGAAPPDFVPPPAGLYDGTEYGKEVQRRRATFWPTMGQP